MIQQYSFWVFIQKKFKARPQKDVCTPMFIAALLTIAKKWEKPSCQSNGIIISLKKEGNSATCYNMDEPWTYYIKWNKPVTERKVLYDSTYVRCLLLLSRFSRVQLCETP